jgi:hypothetical protein
MYNLRTTLQAVNYYLKIVKSEASFFGAGGVIFTRNTRKDGKKGSFHFGMIAHTIS